MTWDSNAATWGWSNLNNLEQVLCIPTEPGLLSNLFIAGPHLTNFIEIDGPVNKKVSLEPLNEFAMRLSCDVARPRRGAEQ